MASFAEMESFFRRFLPAYAAPGPAWTLFLDRDGVLNRAGEGEYIRRPEDFELLPGVLDALAWLLPRFGRALVATNQQGVGKGLVSEADLAAVHGRLEALLAGRGLRLGAIYCCPHLHAAGCDCRKPAPGMALRAQGDFPEIDFARSLMIGDSLRDLQFGRAAGMWTLWANPAPLPPELAVWADGQAESLAAFADAWRAKADSAA
jgi:histidinol-phosphate phosphatase family protein